MDLLDFCGISIHAPRTGSDSFRHAGVWYIPISTHAPRTGSDWFQIKQWASPRNFNPRSPHGERPPPMTSVSPPSAFQPTLPARGATLRSAFMVVSLVIFQPTLPARGATRSFPTPGLSDVAFQPTLPARGATLCSGLLCQAQGISTHAPRTGSDILQTTLPVARQKFQPTLPARGATNSPISSGVRPSHFNPRSPHGERLQGRCRTIKTRGFQPTLPARGATPKTSGKGERLRNFNPRSPHGERQVQIPIITNRTRFQPTLPARGATTFVGTQIAGNG